MSKGLAIMNGVADTMMKAIKEKDAKKGKAPTEGSPKEEASESPDQEAQEAPKKPRFGKKGF